MIKKIFPYLYLLIWGGCTIYSLFIIFLIKTSMVDHLGNQINMKYLFSEYHLFNLVAIALSLVILIMNQRLGHLISFFALIACFFSKSTFLVEFYYFKIFGLTYSWIYLPLLIIFVFINYEILGYWLERLAKNENK